MVFCLGQVYNIYLPDPHEYINKQKSMLNTQNARSLRRPSSVQKSIIALTSMGIHPDLGEYSSEALTRVKSSTTPSASMTLAWDSRDR